MRLLTPPTVFRPRSDSRLLADVVAEQVTPGARVLDLCTGSGILAVAAALAGAGAVVAVDVAALAIWTARGNALLNGAWIDARRGDLYGPAAGGRFDLIVSNPPYLPAGARSRPARGPARAWEGGLDGRDLIDRVIAGAPDHLRPGGALLLLHSSVCGIDATASRLRASGLSVSELARHNGPLGPLLAGRAPALRERGILLPEQQEEDVTVFLATR